MTPQCNQRRKRRRENVCKLSEIYLSQVLRKVQEAEGSRDQLKEGAKGGKNKDNTRLKTTKFF